MNHYLLGINGATGFEWFSFVYIVLIIALSILIMAIVVIRYVAIFIFKIIRSIYFKFK